MNGARDPEAIFYINMSFLYIYIYIIFVCLTRIRLLLVLISTPPLPPPPPSQEGWLPPPPLNNSSGKKKNRRDSLEIPEDVLRHPSCCGRHALLNCLSFYKHFFLSGGIFFSIPLGFISPSHHQLISCQIITQLQLVVFFSFFLLLFFKSAGGCALPSREPILTYSSLQPSRPNPTEYKSMQLAISFRWYSFPRFPEREIIIIN